jgi:hypothetical protein
VATRTVAGDAEKTNTERKRRGQKVVFLRKEKRKQKKERLECFFSRLYFRSFQQRIDKTGKQLFFSFLFISFPFLLQRGIFLLFSFLRL